MLQLLMIIPISQKIALASVNALATVDYSIATKISDNVAFISNWAYEHDQFWLIKASVDTLKYLDDFGSLLIGLVAWIVHNSF